MYPTADERALKAAKEGFGLPAASAEELARFVEEQWDDLSEAERGKGEEREVAVRRVFSTVLDRAVGIDIEGKIDEALADMEK